MNKLGNRCPQWHLIYVCVAGVMVSHKSHEKHARVKEKERESGEDEGSQKKVKGVSAQQ